MMLQLGNHLWSFATPAAVYARPIQVELLEIGQSLQMHQAGIADSSVVQPKRFEQRQAFERGEIGVGDLECAGSAVLKLAYLF
jgi:hypothetical protein